MFTLKIFHADGGYTAIACKTYSILPTTIPDDGSVWISTEPLTKGDGEEFQVETKVIVENANGKTIDVIKVRGNDGNV